MNKFLMVSQNGHSTVIVTGLVLDFGLFVRSVPVLVGCRIIEYPADVEDRNLVIADPESRHGTGRLERATLLARKLEIGFIDGQVGDREIYKYRTVGPGLTEEVATLAARVDEHLKKMGAAWK